MILVFINSQFTCCKFGSYMKLCYDPAKIYVIIQYEAAIYKVKMCSYMLTINQMAVTAMEIMVLFWWREGQSPGRQESQCRIS